MILIILFEICIHILQCCLLSYICEMDASIYPLEQTVKVQHSHSSLGRVNDRLEFCN